MNTSLRTMFTVVCVTVLHAAWIPLLWFWPQAGQVTSTHTLINTLGSREATIAVLFIVVLTAAGAMWRNTADLWTAAAFIPQLFVLSMSALGACFAISNGHFADGVVRPKAFIAADQVIYILLAAAYIAELFDRFGVTPILFRREHGA